MSIPVGRPVHVQGVGPTAWGTVVAAGRDSFGVDLYHVQFEDGGLAWVGMYCITDVTALADRDRACFSTWGSRA